MVHAKRLLTLLAVGCLVSGAGCAVLSPADTSDRSTTTRFAGKVLVVEFANQTAPANASPSTTATFENLSDAKRDEFLTALDHDLRRPDAWDVGTDIRYVRYEGTWYSLHLVFVN